MDKNGFKDHLNSLIHALKSLNKTDNNPSYDWLIKKLSALTIDNLNVNKDVILYFLVDSYSGNKEIGDKIGEFLIFYKASKSK